MAGQSEAADDLIAELAKLMAQDAHDDRKTPPSTSPALPTTVMPVRIPGDTGASAHKPVQASAPAAPASTTSALPAEPSGEPARPAARAPEPKLDFGVAQSSASEETPAAGITQDQPVPPSDETDTIADLIAAELAADSASEPLEPVVPPQRPASQAGPAPVGPVASTTASRNTNFTDRELHPAAIAGTEIAPGAQDRFKIPPVFGLGSAGHRPVVSTDAAPIAATTPPLFSRHASSDPAVLRPAAPPVAAAPAVKSGGADPIDEIESLIGRAMRVELDLPASEAAIKPPLQPAEPAAATAVSQAKAPAAQSPAQRSLATPTLPAAPRGEFSAADEVVFAAAQASGARVGWADAAAPVADEPAAPHAAPRRRAGGLSRAVAGPLVAVTLLLAAFFGLYWVLGLGGGEEGPPPLLIADDAPVKEVAPVAEADSASSSQSVVFNEIDGVATDADEQLVSRDQADVDAVTQDAGTPPELNEEGLANRKVRTVKVRPDGTIVSGDDSVAGSTILPVDRPNVPAVAGAAATGTGLLASDEGAGETAILPAVPETAESVDVEPATESALTPATIIPVEPGATVPAVDSQGNPIAGRTTVIPRLRPEGLTLPVGSQVQAQLGAAPVAAAAPSLSIPGATEVPALADTAPAYVQLASQRSEADARQSAQNLVTRYGPLFGGANLEVQRVDLGTRGIYYRVRVPANSLEQANMICTNVKAAGGDCFTL